MRCQVGSVMGNEVWKNVKQGGNKTHKRVLGRKRRPAPPHRRHHVQKHRQPRRECKRVCFTCVEIQSENCESVVLRRDRRGRTGSVINLPADSSRAEIDGGPSHRPAATLRAAVTLWAVTFMQPAWRTETGSEHQTPNTLRQCGSSGGGSSPWVPV